LIPPVAAALLLREGYDVWVVSCDSARQRALEGAAQGGEHCEVDPPVPRPRASRGAAPSSDAADARRVAGLLGVPFYVLNFEQDFGRVIDYFVSNTTAAARPIHAFGATTWLKFGKLAQYAKAVGADYVASGHYARVGPDPVTGKRA